MYKICLCVFSTNRPEYLSRTLEAQKHLDFTGCEVHRMLFDDFPKGRDDGAIVKLAQSYGYTEIYLHQENMSIGATWEHFWNTIRDRDYDYVLHQEDDVEILERVAVTDMIDFFQTIPRLSQVVLKRQPWYSHEKPSEALPGDVVFKGFRGEFSPAQVYFTPISSLYPMDRVRFDYHAWYRKFYSTEPIFHTANINEALIGKALLESGNLRSMHLKNSAGKNIISHIGEYTVGKKLLPHEPGYAIFAGLDPEVRYVSNTNQPYKP